VQRVLLASLIVPRSSAVVTKWLLAVWAGLLLVGTVVE